MTDNSFSKPPGQGPGKGSIDRMDRSDKEIKCPLCGKLMVLRTARKEESIGDVHKIIKFMKGLKIC